ncbi:helix-turn-helix domain-containing protein [Candidatus Protochlamydia phocaeensis]|uniref:helix-turn-helix domain-containing protein n=1 Tax=Candidatus Protochlamydia phocaeensis TaxID=1414722 RepID=UPI00083849D8|nr:helix-turn-helix transcriptional regulator [Candidatus Protochlamydia phocaeensis]
MSADEMIRKICGDLPEWAVTLRGLRNREGLTQAALGNLLGIAQTNISKMELGKRPIGKTIAKRLADLFHTDYRLFL